MGISGRDTEGTCEPVGVTQKRHDHNYFCARSVVNKVHPNDNNVEYDDCGEWYHLKCVGLQSLPSISEQWKGSNC